jgi:hypothetical protein
MSAPSPSVPPTPSGQVGANHCAVRAILQGAIGFLIVSVAGFSVWAFGGKWFYKQTGEAGMYAACAVVFLGLSGLLLHPLVEGQRRLVRFYLIFVPSFLAYAILWCAAWFALRFGLGEWLGALAGCVGFVALVARGFKNYRGFIKVCIVVFLFHSIGYFLGGRFMHWLGGADGAALTGCTKSQLSELAKLSWGAFYGLGFGAGIGFAFHSFQRPEKSPA